MQSYGFDISHMFVQCMYNRVILATLQLEEVLDIDLFIFNLSCCYTWNLAEQAYRSYHNNNQGNQRWKKNMEVLNELKILKL